MFRFCAILKKTNPASVSRGFCSLFSLCSVLGSGVSAVRRPGVVAKERRQDGRHTRRAAPRRVPRPRRHANHQPPAVFAGQVQPRLGESLIGAGGAVPGLAGLPFDNAALFAECCCLFHEGEKPLLPSRFSIRRHSIPPHPPACFSTLHSPAPRGWLRPLRFLARSIFGVFFSFGQEPTYDRPHYRTPYQGRR